MQKISFFSFRLAKHWVSSVTYLSFFILSISLISGCESEVKLRGNPDTASNDSTPSTVTNYGVLDVTQAWLGNGQYTSYNAAALPVTEVCSSSQIFGVAGTAVCNPTPLVFSDLMASMAYRSDNDSFDPSTAGSRVQATLTDEGAANGVFTANHSLVPNPATDHDGRYDPQGGSNSRKHHLVTVKGGRPDRICGTSGSIQDRVDECDNENGAKAIYEGQKYGQGGEGDWRLVTLVSTDFCRDQNYDGDQAGCVSNYGTPESWTGSHCAPYPLIRDPAGCAGGGFTWTAPQGVAVGNPCKGGFWGGCFEVWRDERTKLIWSDLHTNEDKMWNWFQAAGYSKNASTQTDTYYEGAGPTAAGGGRVYTPQNCSNPGTTTCQDNVPISVCADAGAIAGLNGVATYQNPDGTNGSVDETYAKGNLIGAAYQWRLPTIEDFELANVNGIRKVLQSMDDYGFWSASSYSNNARYAWAFFGVEGGLISYVSRVSSNGVLCVGR